MSGWYLRIIWRYDDLICGISAPSWRSRTRYHSSSFASVLPGRGGRLVPPELLEPLELLELDELLVVSPPRAACSFIRRNASSAAARCLASRSSRSLWMRA